MKPKTIGERLLILRTEYNLTSEKLANLIGVTRVTIDNIEKGVSNPYRSNVEKLALKLGTTIEWLSEGKGEMLPNGKSDLSSEEKSDNKIDELIDQLKRESEKAWSEVEFLREIIRDMRPRASANFPQALNKTGSAKIKHLNKEEQLRDIAA